MLSNSLFYFSFFINVNNINIIKKENRKKNLKFLEILEFFFSKKKTTEFIYDYCWNTEKKYKKKFRRFTPKLNYEINLG